MCDCEIGFDELDNANSPHLPLHYTIMQTFYFVNLCTKHVKKLIFFRKFIVANSGGGEKGSMYVQS